MALVGSENNGQEMAKKALVAYGTRYGSTAKAAEAIAEELARGGYWVKVCNLMGTAPSDVEAYDLIVVGSSIYLGRWLRPALSFLRMNQSQLARKKVALFVCCGDVLSPSKESSAQRKYLQKVAESFPGLGRVSMGLFGGAIDKSKYGFFVRSAFTARMIVTGQRRALRSKGVDVSKAYDFRDWAAIREWSRSLYGIQPSGVAGLGAAREGAPNALADSL